MALEKWEKNKQKLACFKKPIKIKWLLNSQQPFDYFLSKEKKQRSKLLKHASVCFITFASLIRYFFPHPIAIFSNKIEARLNQAILILAKGSGMPSYRDIKYERDHLGNTDEELVHNRVSTGNKELKYSHDLLWRKENLMKTLSRWYEMEVDLNYRNYKDYSLN